MHTILTILDIDKRGKHVAPGLSPVVDDVGHQFIRKNWVYTPGQVAVDV